MKFINGATGKQIKDKGQYNEGTGTLFEPFPGSYTKITHYLIKRGNIIMGTNSYLTTSAELLNSSDKAYKIMTYNGSCWLPKSQLINVTISEVYGSLNNNILNFDIPEWLANKKGIN